MAEAKSDANLVEVGKIEALGGDDFPAVLAGVLILVLISVALSLVYIGPWAMAAIVITIITFVVVRFCQNRRLKAETDPRRPVIFLWSAVDKVWNMPGQRLRADHRPTPVIFPQYISAMFLDQADILVNSAKSLNNSSRGVATFIAGIFLHRETRTRYMPLRNLKIS